MNRLQAHEKGRERKKGGGREGEREGGGEIGGGERGKGQRGERGREGGRKEREGN